MIAAPFQSLLQGFFTDRLLRQRQASPHTIAGYRADLHLKEQALSRVEPLGVKPSRYRPDDHLLRFLESL